MSVLGVEFLGYFFISVPLPQMNSKTNRQLVVYFEN